MNSKIKLLIIYLLIFYTSIQAREVPVPTVQSVNIITGQLEIPNPLYHYDRYVAGSNHVAGAVVELDEGDWRIHRIKSLRERDTDKQPTFFYYYENHTEVFDSLGHKTGYRYSDKQLLEAIEQYASEKRGYHLYRRERFFWVDSGTSPKIVSHVLEDGTGHVHYCCLNEYSPQGHLSKETLFGRLSGMSETPILVGTDGRPKQNGAESYSVYYEYDPEDPSLLLRQQEDNGSSTTYGYDPNTQECVAKFRQDARGVISRCFYFYDSEGFLNRTILDDGSGKNHDDLEEITNRQIIDLQICPSGPARGQPIVTETKYFDIESGIEMLLEKNVCTYSLTGKLIQKDFYDANESLRYDIRFNYDENDTLLSTVDSRGEAAIVPENESPGRHNTSSQRGGVIDQYGNKTSYLLDSFGRLVKTISPLILDAFDRPIRPTVTQEYDIENNVTSFKDANGNETHTEYNQRGKPTKIQYPDGSKERFFYFPDGTLRESHDRSDLKTIYERDAFGRILRKTEETSEGETLRSLEYTYRRTKLVSITDNKHFTVNLKYDSAGRHVGTLHQTDAGIKRTEWSYDASGEKTETKEWYGAGEEEYVSRIEKKDGWQQTQQVHFEDASGDVQKTIKSQPEKLYKPLFSQDLFTQNSLGQSVRLQEIVDDRGVKKLTRFDALNRPEHVVLHDPLGRKIAEINLRHDGNGNNTLENRAVITGNEQASRSHTIRREYDPLNRLLSVTESDEAGQAQTTAYRYHASGEVAEIIKPNGTVLFYLHDSKNRLERFYASDFSFDYAYLYDHQGRLVQTTDRIHGTTIQRSYDGFNQLIEENLGEGLSLKNEYDLGGRRIGISLPDGSGVSYNYEGALLKSIERTGDLSYKHTYFYDKAGRIVQNKLIGQAGLLEFKYDAENRVQHIQSQDWSETIGEEGFNNQGRVVQLIVEDPVGRTTQVYDYTPDDQLAEERGGFENEYTYDSLFNRTSKNGEKWESDGLNRLIKTPKISYQYDSNGNRTEKKSETESFTYQYDALNRMVMAIKKEEVSFKYIYDSFHRRIARITHEWNAALNKWHPVKTERFLYDGDREIGKINQEGCIEELRILGVGKGAEIGAAVAIELRGQVYAPIHDLRGSVRCLIDIKDGHIAEFYRYSAYGEELIFEDSGNSLDESKTGNPWRFSSKRMDSETDLILYGKRYYDVSTGSWTTPDPLFFYDSPNLYTYVRNDPVNLRDLYGLFSIGSLWDSAIQSCQRGIEYVVHTAQTAGQALMARLKLPFNVSGSLEKVGLRMLGKQMMIMMGYYRDSSSTGSTEGSEPGDKVRITFINGILTTQDFLFENLSMISQSHGGCKVHYVFRATQGWVGDIGDAIAIKPGYWMGFESHYSRALAEKWRALILEMGGVEGGGTIIHYAHSLGGTETDRARDLLTPEEQKMIRVISIGSSTLIRNQGYQNVTNYMSTHDGIRFFDPLGLTRNMFTSQSNLKWLNERTSLSTFFLADHTLNCDTYRNLFLDLGRSFLEEFALR